MPRGGARPNTGGARPNSGPKKGTRYVTKIKATPEELDEVRHAVRRGPEARRLKDQLAEYAHLVATFALQYQPKRDAAGTALRDAQGRPVWDEADYERFKSLMSLFGYLAGKGAPFQDPTFKAIAIAVDTPQMPGDDAKIINLKIFDHTGNIIKDEILEG